MFAQPIEMFGVAAQLPVTIVTGAGYVAIAVAVAISTLALSILVLLAKTSP